MLLGLHTYSLYLHGIGQAWAGFKLPWPRQLTTFELFDRAVRWGLDGLHLDDGVLENLAPRSFTNHFRDDRIEFERHGFKLTGTAVGDGDIDIKRAYEIIKTKSSMNRINIETEMEIPLDDMETALRMEKEIVERSIKYCREVLGIRKDNTR
jgi:hypothetical protein